MFFSILFAVFMERVGEESVFFVINDPLRDLIFLLLKILNSISKEWPVIVWWPICLEVLSGDRGLIPKGKGAARVW